MQMAAVYILYRRFFMSKTNSPFGTNNTPLGSNETHPEKVTGKMNAGLGFWWRIIKGGIEDAKKKKTD